jgi:hypothetical protein
MIKKSLFEELCIHIDKEELAQLLGADSGFSVQNVEEERGGFRILLSRETTLEESSAHPQTTDIPRQHIERRSFL